MESGSDRSLQMLIIALEKEEKGRDFYKEAAEKCSNSLGREFFQMLMRDEGIHIKRIKDIYDSLRGKMGWSAEWKNYKVDNDDLHKLTRKRIIELGSRIRGNSDDLEALDIGIQMEQGAIKFYEEQLAKASDVIEKEFIELMLREEHNHFAALEDLKLYFSDPEAWYIEAEKPTLDGAC